LYLIIREVYSQRTFGNLYEYSSFNNTKKSGRFYMETDEQGLNILFENAEKMKEEGRPEEAIKELEKIIELAPRNLLAAKAEKDIGDTYSEWNISMEDSEGIDIKDNEKAVQHYLNAIKIDPNQLEAYYALGKTYSCQENIDGALEQYNKVLNSNPNVKLKAECLLEIGLIYQNQEKYDDALKEYEKILELDLDNSIKSEAIRAIGETYALKGDYDQALQKFSEAKEFDNTLEDARLQLAFIIATKSEEDGIDQYKKIIESDPNSELAANAYIGIGNIYFDKDEFKDAEINYKEAIKISPLNKLAAESFSDIGDYYRDQKKYDDAIRNYKEALKIDPNIEDAHFFLAESLYEKKLHKEALIEIDEAIRINPKDASNHNLKGVIFWKKQYQKAIEEFNKAKELAPTYYYPHLNLARLYEHKKQNEKAIEEHINCLKYAENKRQKTSARKKLKQLGKSEKDIEKIVSGFEPIKETVLTSPVTETMNAHHKNIERAQSPNDIAHLSKKTFLPVDFLENLNELLESKLQIIFYGVPGTGKTFVAKEFAKYFTNCASEADLKNQFQLIQFHQSYSYEEFMEGIRPEPLEDNKGMSYPIKAGIFKTFCEEAGKNRDKKYLLIIDEINRGNISKIFGELLFLLEYRDNEITLPYSKKPFSIPDNVYIIGTMNTADRSIAFVDYALRRRFYFVEFQPNKEVLEKWLNENPNKKSGIDVLNLFTKLNDTIKNDLDEHHQIGHSYFMIEKGILDEKRLKLIWDYNIMPLLKEYFFTKTNLDKYSFDSMIKG
jgi:tetratricopeptide (TPR) repeat protein